MPKYLIERDVPGLGKLSTRDLQAMAIKSNRVLEEQGPDIQWQHSYVSDDKLYCVYISKDESLIHEHAKRGEFPIKKVYPVKTLMDPTTGEENGQM